MPKQVTVTLTVIMIQMIQDLSLVDFSCQDLEPMDMNSLQDSYEVKYLAMMLWAVIINPLMMRLKEQPAEQTARVNVKLPRPTLGRKLQLQAAMLP